MLYYTEYKRIIRETKSSNFLKATLFSKQKTMKKKKIIYEIRQIFLGIAFIIGLVLLFNKPITNYLIENYHPVVFSDQIKTEQKAKAPYDWASIKPLNLFSVAKARIYHPQIKVIGGIYNEKLGLNVPIVNGVDQTIYSLCAGALEPNEKMGQGNYSIAAHNVSSSKDALFAPIYQKAKVGDTLNITNFHKVYTYKIYAKAPISEHNNTVLENSTKPSLTLVTCETGNQNSQKRFIYQAKLAKISNYNDVSATTKAFLNEKYSFKLSKWNMIYLHMLSNSSNHQSK